MCLLGSGVRLGVIVLIWLLWMCRLGWLSCVVLLGWLFMIVSGWWISSEE